METTNYDKILAFIEEDLIKGYIEKTINEYDVLARNAQLKFNILTTSAIVLTASIAPITLIKCNLLTAVIASISTILNTMIFVFNFKYEWQTHLVSLIYHKGLLNRFKLELNEIKFSNDKIDKEKKLLEGTRQILDQFNNYEYKEIKSYFQQIRDMGK